MKNIKVSIICISYNQEKYIEQALEGFVSQKTNFGFEAIVADDGSDDETSDIIRRYARNYPDIIKPVLRDRNIGIQDNLIDALKRAKGDYLALCEGDDYWIDNNKLQKQADFLDKNKDYNIVFHPVRVVFENADIEPSLFPLTTDKNEFTVENLLRENFIQTNTVMYRKISYNKLSNEAMPFDWYLHLSHVKGKKIGFINNTMAVYRRHEGGVWWGVTKSDKKSHWYKHGKGYAAVCNELLSMYKEDLHRNIISKNIGNFLREIHEVSGHDNDFMRDIVETYPRVAAVGVGTLVDIIIKEEDNSDRRVQDLTSTINELREAVSYLETALMRVRSSRIVKIRNKAAKYLHKSSL